MKKRWTKWLCLGLSVCLLLAGCTKQESKNEEMAQKEVPLGRYVENKVEMPAFSEEEGVINVFWDKENKLAVYTVNKNQITRYLLEENQEWKTELVSWTEKIRQSGKEFTTYSTSVSLGQDGNYYLFYFEGEEQGFRPHLYKSADGQNAEEISMEGWDKKNPESGFYPFFSKVAVNKNGEIAAVSAFDMKLYRPDGSDTKMHYQIGAQGEGLAVNENYAISIDETNSNIIFCNFETGEISYQIPIESNHSFSYLLAGEEGDIFMVNSTGINHLTEGGTTWETIVEGGLSSLSLPTYYGMKLVKGNQNDFYVSMRDDNQNYVMMHYVYDETIPSVPSQEITIYSLKDMGTVWQAIGEFQSANPDVRVTYRVAEGAENATTTADKIRALNTELLAGKGADILILDGLPIDSYIEKGVLEDIGSFIEPMIASGELVENFMQDYKKEEKIYAVPTRVGIPIISGKQDVLEAAKDLQSLAQYADKTEKALLGRGSVSGLIKWLYRMYGRELITEEGALDQQKLIVFLENFQTISKKMDFIDESEQVDDIFDTFGIAMGTCSMNLEEISGMADAIWPISLAKEANMIIQPIQEYFIPHGIVGLNHASQKKDLAKEWMKTLLSESVQRADLYEGFPVNNKALENWISTEKNMSVSVGWNNSDVTFEAEWPTEEERRTMVEICCSLTTAMETDNTLLEMIIDEAYAFYRKEKDAEATAQAIVSRTKAYLSE